MQGQAGECLAQGRQVEVAEVERVVVEEDRMGAVVHQLYLLSARGIGVRLPA
ncbi:hypothetical protein D3C78_1715040 [compost metagenome]